VAKQFLVYIVANKGNGTHYICVTSNLVQRAWQHKQDAIEGSTQKYGVRMLVYFESHEALAKLKKTVTPAKSGVQKPLKNLDSRFRGNDGAW
jgi:predicted GIY-YIG superfamily endonuclease